jgi:hypothetical protein
MSHPVFARTRPPIAAFAVSLLVAALFAALPVHAAGGRIGFTGGIAEATCPMRGHLPACPPDRPAAATVHVRDEPQALADIHAALLDHALRRDPAVHWQVVETTYR